LRGFAAVDRATIEQHLAQAERHVAEGESYVERQRQIVAELERDGHDAATAKALLATFEEMQATQIAERDRLRQALRNATGG